MYISGKSSAYYGINREDAVLLTKYRRLNLRGMTEFLLSDFVKPAVQNISSLLTGNSVKIFIHSRLPTDGTLGARIEMLSKCFTSITEDVIRNILGYGFATCALDVATGDVSVVDYQNGDIFFHYDTITREYTFAWVRNLFHGDGGERYIDTKTMHLRERRIEPNCVHYIAKAPTDTGVLSGAFAPLLRKFFMARDLNNYGAETERRKVMNPLYYKRQFPPLKFEEYTMMVEHTIKNSLGNATGAAPDFADANNLGDRGAGVGAIFGTTRRLDARDMARRMRNFLNNESVTLDRKSGRPVVGPLVDLVFMPLNEPSEQAQRIGQELRDAVLEYVACYQFVSTTRAGNVKEYAGQVGMFLNPVIMKLKATMDGFCTVLARESLADIMSSEVENYLRIRAERRARRREAWLNERANERIKEQEERQSDMTDAEREEREREDELERMTYEAREIAAYELLQEEMMAIKVEFDPMLYVSDADKELLLKTTLPFDRIAKPVFGGDGLSFGDLTDVMTLENAKLALEWAKIEQKDREIKAKADEVKAKAKVEKEKAKAASVVEEESGDAEESEEREQKKQDEDEKPKKAKEKKPKKKEKKPKKKPKKTKDDEDEEEEEEEGEDDEEEEEEEKKKPKKKPKKGKEKKPKKKEKKPKKKEK